MKRYIFLLLAICPAFAQADEVDCENAMTTYAMNVCAGREMAAADAMLEKYIAKAKERYHDETTVIELLNSSQDAWMVYRKEYCDSIYEIWSGGTVRGVMFGGCMLQLTKQRTYNIWADYLTYMDSTPPLLPEPK